MIDTKVARRYSKSLIDLAKDQGVLDSANKDMAYVLKVIKANRELRALLNNPIISADKKVKILTAVFSSNITKLTNEFITLLTKKGRDNYLEEIARQFIAEYKRLKGVETVIITTAVGLDDKLRKEVLEMVKTNTKSEIDLVEVIDKSIIGGFIVKMGDKQYDASIARNLQKISRELNDNSFVNKN